MKDKIISHWTVAVGVLLMIAVGSLPVLFTNTLRNTSESVTNNNTLVMWGLFDEREVYQGMIEQYESQTGVKVKYYKISNTLAEYEKLLLNEIAEGKGPDIFVMKNTWLPKHIGKTSPMPENLLSAESYERTFVPAVSDDLVREDRIYGIPLYVDSLALYYNDEIFKANVPSKTKPSATWDELKNDVIKITHADNSLERFTLVGASLGRMDNITRGFDVLLLQMLQRGVSLHDESGASAIFADQKSSDGNNPAQNVWRFFSSFASPSYENYNWNEEVTLNNPAKEVDAFARGKVAMIFGYSYLYEDIKNQIKEVNKKGGVGINFANVKIAPIPQADENSQVALANYFPYTVSRNSQNPEMAWRFLVYLTREENLREYNRQTDRPTAVRSLIDEQSLDKTYGVFASQSEYAQSVVMWDENYYREVFADEITKINTGRSTVEDAVREAQNKINTFLKENRTLKNTTNAE
jgi:ABC-type glycerol-3-phosphate transport system substrate-binding protein